MINMNCMMKEKFLLTFTSDMRMTTFIFSIIQEYTFECIIQVKKYERYTKIFSQKEIVREKDFFF